MVPENRSFAALLMNCELLEHFLRIRAYLLMGQMLEHVRWCPYMYEMYGSYFRTMELTYFRRSVHPYYRTPCFRSYVLPYFHTYGLLPIPRSLVHLCNFTWLSTAIFLFLIYNTGKQVKSRLQTFSRSCLELFGHFHWIHTHLLVVARSRRPGNSLLRRKRNCELNIADEEKLSQTRKCGRSQRNASVP